MIYNPTKVIENIISWLHSYMKEWNKTRLIIQAPPPDCNPSIGCKLIINLLESTNIRYIYHIGQQQLFELSGETGLLVGMRTKEQMYLRNWNKWERFDLLPFFSLYESELFQLGQHLNIEIENPKIYSKFLGLEFSAANLEWATRENFLYGIVTENTDPLKNRVASGYTQPQREIITRLHQIEKRTRHKTNTLPFPNLRDQKSCI